MSLDSFPIGSCDEKPLATIEVKVDVYRAFELLLAPKRQGAPDVDVPFQWALRKAKVYNVLSEFINVSDCPSGVRRTPEVMMMRTRDCSLQVENVNRTRLQWIPDN